MTVAVETVSRRFGATAALHAVSLALEPGEFAALLGPSGSGKTTLLRILAGLDFADEGRVLLEGRDVAAVPARQRGVGVVFQHYALFRHMSVFENVAFGLRVRPRRLRPAEAEIGRRVRELLDLVQIGELAHRRPDELSGGQRQRVALARALATEPRLLLLDEPFGALDALVRKEVRRWVRGLHDRLGLTSILVTHDQEEAMEMADRVAVMNEGRVVQFATPQALLDDPATAFVAGFLGDANQLAARVSAGRLHLPSLPALETPHLPDGDAEVFIRPFQLVIGPPGEGRPAPGRVVTCRPEGVGGHRIVAAVGEAQLEGVGRTAMQRGSPCVVSVQEVTIFVDGRRNVVRPMSAAPSGGEFLCA